MLPQLDSKTARRHSDNTASCVVRALVVSLGAASIARAAARLACAEAGTRGADMAVALVFAMLDAQLTRHNQLCHASWRVCE